jgi:hypothetical protein
MAGVGAPWPAWGLAGEEGRGKGRGRGHDGREEVEMEGHHEGGAVGC